MVGAESAGNRVHVSGGRPAAVYEDGKVTLLEDLPAVRRARLIVTVVDPITEAAPTQPHPPRLIYSTIWSASSTFAKTVPRSTTAISSDKASETVVFVDRYRLNKVTASGFDLVEVGGPEKDRRSRCFGNMLVRKKS